jgi:hypothetical protein
MTIVGGVSSNVSQKIASSALHQAHQCYFTMQSTNLTMKMFRINNVSRIVDKLCMLKAKGKKKGCSSL